MHIGILYYPHMHIGIAYYPHTICILVLPICIWEEMPGEITLLDRNGLRITLERLNVSVAAESLGVWIAIDGNQEK